MERPNKKEYNFNDYYEGLRFIHNMLKYADYLEGKVETLEKMQQLKEVTINVYESTPIKSITITGKLTP